MHCGRHLPQLAAGMRTCQRSVCVRDIGPAVCYAPAAEPTSSHSPAGRRQEGVAALWTGVGPNIVRNVAVSTSALASYDQIKETLIRMGARVAARVVAVRRGRLAGLSRKGGAHRGDVMHPVWGSWAAARSLASAVL